MFNYIKNKINSKPEVQVETRAEPVVNVVEVPQPAAPVIIKRNINTVVHNRKNLADEYAARAYDAAQSSKKLAGWNGSYATADADIKAALVNIRAHSRELEQNNDYYINWLASVETNIVGPNGFNLQMRIYENDRILDKLANKLFEENFKKWSKRGNCDVTGRLSFDELQRLVIRTVARDGECIIRRIRDKTINKWGYALQVLEIDRLAVHANRDLKNGNKVVMGVEMNKYGRAVAYYILKDLNLSANAQYGEYDRVPAEDIFHLYKAHRAEQTRGIPWAHSVMITLHQLGSYQDAALTASRGGAMMGGFYTTPEGDLSEIADDEDEDGQLVKYLEPGTFQALPPGYDFTPFNPTYPVQAYPEYVKSNLRSVASGLLVSYHTLSNDLEKVNFSSIRAGVLAERDMWMTTQSWFISAFLEPLYTDFITESLTNGAIAYPGGAALPIAKQEKFESFEWSGRRWSWVSPVDEINAAIKAIDGGLGTRRKVLSDMGLDVDDVLDDLEYEQNTAQEKKLTISSQTPPSVTNNMVEVTAKSILDKVDLVERSLDVMRATPAPQAAPNITVAPLIRMPGVKTVKRIIRDERGLTTHTIEEDEETAAEVIKQQEEKQED